MQILNDDECDQITGGYVEPSTLGGLPATLPTLQVAPYEAGDGRGPLLSQPFAPLDPMVFAER